MPSSSKKAAYPEKLVLSCALLSAVVFPIVLAGLPPLFPLTLTSVVSWIWLVQLGLHVLGLLVVVLKVQPFVWLVDVLKLKWIFAPQWFLWAYLLFTVIVGGYLLYDIGWAITWYVEAPMGDLMVY